MPEHLLSRVQEALMGAAAAQKNEEEAPREGIVRLLRQHEGNVAAVARTMGKQRVQVHRRLKRYGIDRQRFRANGES